VHELQTLRGGREVWGMADYRWRKLGFSTEHHKNPVLCYWRNVSVAGLAETGRETIINMLIHNVLAS